MTIQMENEMRVRTEHEKRPEYSDPTGISPEEMLQWLQCTKFDGEADDFIISSIQVAECDVIGKSGGGFLQKNNNTDCANEAIPKCNATVDGFRSKDTESKSVSDHNYFSGQNKRRKSSRKFKENEGVLSCELSEDVCSTYFQRMPTLSPTYSEGFSSFLSTEACLTNESIFFSSRLEENERRSSIEKNSVPSESAYEASRRGGSTGDENSPSIYSETLLSDFCENDNAAFDSMEHIEFSHQKCKWNCIPDTKKLSQKVDKIPAELISNLSPLPFGVCDEKKSATTCHGEIYSKSCRSSCKRKSVILDSLPVHDDTNHQRQQKRQRMEEVSSFERQTASPNNQLLALNPRMLTSMRNSQESQTAIENWDKNMGLKRSHCKTMQSTSGTRYALLGVQRSYDFAMKMDAMRLNTSRGVQVENYFKKDFTRFDYSNESIGFAGGGRVPLPTSPVYNDPHHALCA